MEKFVRDGPELRRHIQELIAEKGGGHNEDLVADIIENALKMLTDVESRGDSKVIQTAVRELRYAFRLFAPHAGIRKVTMFGSARTAPGKQEYRQAVDFAHKIAAAGWMIITGAGPGIMQAGHEGAGPEKSFGANIRLPWEQSPNPIIQKDKKLITFKYFFTRKLTFLRHSDAIALFPGGFGTMDEGFEALTLMQTGKALIIPILFIDRPDGRYWETWMRFLTDHLLKLGLISKEDFNFIQIEHNVEEAVKHILLFYRNYQSSRWVGSHLVLRIAKKLTAKAVAELNKQFADLLREGPIVQRSALPQEKNQPEIWDLPRIVLTPHRHQFGRYRQLIDAINLANTV